jgi:hypothetical protein
MSAVLKVRQMRGLQSLNFMDPILRKAVNERSHLLFLYLASSLSVT